MGGVTTRNMQSSLQKYNKLYTVASCWTIIDIKITVTFLTTQISTRTRNLLVCFNSTLWLIYFNSLEPGKYENWSDQII